MRRFLELLLGVAIPFLVVGCGSSGSPNNNADEAEDPSFALLRFSAGSAIVDNPYFPLVPGTIWIHASETQDGVETIVVEVLSGKRFVAGVECASVHDRVYLDDLLIEDTHDWYAQDDEGLVWYLGEEVMNFEYDDDGVEIGRDSEGAWEAGVDGAVAGIIMKADFVVGDRYRQEFYEDEAEDVGEIVAIDVPVTLANGMSYSCVKIRDTTALEPGAEKFKYFAPNLGLVKEENVDEDVEAELLGVFDNTLASLPDRSAATFTNPFTINNPYLPFPQGSTTEYEVETEDGTEHIVIEVLPTTRVVDGVECAVVRDTVYLDGVLIEDTHDWYAQDDAGNVWYFGELVVNHELDDDGIPTGATNNDGSWETGVDGARPGITMWANAVVGRPYRQELWVGEAEDMAIVVATGVSITLSYGTTYTNCRQTLDWVPLEASAVEFKWYAPGIGLVAEEHVFSGERLELILDP